MNIENIIEINEGIYCKEDVDLLLKDKKVMLVQAKNRPMLVGKQAMIKVNCNVGITNLDDEEAEIRKVNEIASLKFRPDSMMDLSIVNGKKPLWETLLEEFDGPIGYLPHYTCYDSKKGINSNMLMERLEYSFEKGVGFITIHPTTDRKIHSDALSSRVIPSTSRGGVIVYKDMIINNRDHNIFEELFSDIVDLCRKYCVTLSIGTTYRPATIGDALDKVHIQELKKQKELFQYAWNNGINVMIEGIGHITLSDIIKYKEIIGDENINLMPLGPLPTDAAIGFDHVSSAIGATFAAYIGLANIINVVTRDEHTGGIPDLASIIEGIKAANVSARCVNLTRFEKLKGQECDLSKLRAIKKSCILAGGLFDYNTISYKSGCSRCAEKCPLL